MIEPKPLTRERAKEIEEHFWQFQAILQSQSSDQVMQEMSVSLITHMPGDFMDLLAAEAYQRQEAERWRKIVAGMIHDTVEGYCQFCGHYVVRYTEDHNSNRQVVPHKSNCPAVLAQDFV